MLSVKQEKQLIPLLPFEIFSMIKLRMKPSLL